MFWLLDLSNIKQVYSKVPERIICSCANIICYFNRHFPFQNVYKEQQQQHLGKLRGLPSCRCLVYFFFFLKTTSFV